MPQTACETSLSAHSKSQKLLLNTARSPSPASRVEERPLIHTTLGTEMVSPEHFHDDMLSSQRRLKWHCMLLFKHQRLTLHTEQPGAPQTQDNTAVIPEPLESITPIETKHTDVSSAQSTSDQGPGAGAGAGLTAALPVAPQPSSTPAQEKSQSQSTTPNTNLESGSGPGNPTVDEPSPAQEQSNPTASSADTTTSTGSSSSSNNNAPTQSEPEKPAPEQRSQAMPDGDSSSQQKEDGGVPGGVERAPPATTQQVSVEALKGPQGPAPRDAYEFEKEMDGKPSKTRTG